MGRSFSRLSQINRPSFFFFSTAISPLLAQPQRRQWYDRLADSILGDDDPNIASPSSRYALICEKCFTHNGLVKESMWEDARKLFNNLFSLIKLDRLTFFFGLLFKEYVCPKCNHFNASKRSKRSRQQQITSPNASATSSPSSPPVTPASITRQPSSLPQSPQESDLPNVDHMEVDNEVEAST